MVEFWAEQERVLAESLAQSFGRGWMRDQDVRFQVAKMTDPEARRIVFRALGETDPLAARSNPSDPA